MCASTLTLRDLYFSDNSTDCNILLQFVKIFADEIHKTLMKQLRGKTALVTGASRGLGRHIVRALAAEGMNLVLSARDTAALEEIANDVRGRGTRVTCIAADLRQRPDVEMLAKAAAAEPGIAVLVNNAGIESAHSYSSLDLERIDEMIAVNLRAPMLLARLMLPHMIARGEGHIVSVASLAGLVGTPYEEPYAATKAGVVGFSRSLYQSLREDGHRIGVSVICPGFISGDGMYQHALDATGAGAPAMLGTVPIEKVAAAVVHAIKHDQPEVVMSGKPIMPFLVIQAMSPKLAAKLSALSGIPRMFRKWARGG